MGAASLPHGAGQGGGKRGLAGMGACLLPLGVPKCLGEKGFVGGGGAGKNNTFATNRFMKSDP